MLKTDQNQAPPVVGVTNPNVNRPYADVSPAAPDRGHRRDLGHPRLSRPARQAPAAIRERLLVPDRLHLRQDDRPRLGQRRRRDPDQRLRPRLQPRARRLRRDAHAQLELDLRAAVRPAESSRRLAGRTGSCTGAPACPFTVTQTEPCSRRASRTTGPTGSATAERPTRPSSSGSTPRRSSRPRTGPAPSAARAGTSCAGPGSSTWTCRSSSTTRFGRVEPSCESRPSTSSITRSSPSPTASSAARLRNDHHHAPEPRLRHLRHDRAAGPARAEAPVLARAMLHSPGPSRSLRDRERRGRGRHGRRLQGPRHAPRADGRDQGREGAVRASASATRRSPSPPSTTPTSARCSTSGPTTW